VNFDEFTTAGDWVVEVKGDEPHLRESYANAFDEPVGGLMNVILIEDGRTRDTIPAISSLKHSYDWMILTK